MLIISQLIFKLMEELCQKNQDCINELVSVPSKQKSGKVKNVPGTTTERIYQDIDDIIHTKSDLSIFY